MIDIEADIFDYVYPSVAPLVPEGCFKSVYVPAPPALPFATLIEMENVTDSLFQTSSGLDEHAIITYEANVYAEEKFECKEIMSVIDTALRAINFKRVSLQFVPNLADSTLFRYTARFRASVNPQKTVYRTN